MGFFSDIIGFVAGNEAADAQADGIVEGNRQSSQTLMQMFNQSNQLNAPTRIAGDRTRDEQLALLGMAPTSGYADTGVPTPGGSYVDANPDLANAFATLTPEHQRHLVSGGYDTDGDGQISSGEFGGFHYSQHGAAEGRSFEQPQAAAVGQPTNALAADGAQDAAYDRFLGGGFNRSMTDVTNNDMDQMIGAFGAGGTAMSGSTLGALNDRNRRNTNNAFTQHWNALGGMSGQATQVAAQQGQNALHVGQQIGDNQANSSYARGSSYANRAMGLGNLAQSGVNALGNWFGGV